MISRMFLMQMCYLIRKVRKIFKMFLEVKNAHRWLKKYSKTVIKYYYNLKWLIGF